MGIKTNKLEVFSILKPIIANYSDGLTIIADKKDSYYLNTRHIMESKKALFFAGVEIKKNYVSFHLMPVYIDPSLLKDLSEPLKKSMQGKSCFNFIKTETELIDELKELTDRAYQYYLQQGYV